MNSDTWSPCVSLGLLMKCIKRQGISNGGDERDRTVDLLVANEALSQLSYIPTSNALREWSETPHG